MENQIKLDHRITFGWLILFALPTILSSIFMNLYSTVDGVFVARKIGEEKHKEAREDFSLLMLSAFIFSVVLTIISFIFLDPLCRFLGSDDGLLHYCREYMIPVLISLPFAVFGMVFQLSFITVGKAGKGI